MGQCRQKQSGNEQLTGACPVADATSAETGGLLAAHVREIVTGVDSDVGTVSESTGTEKTRQRVSGTAWQVVPAGQVVVERRSTDSRGKVNGWRSDFDGSLIQAFCAPPHREGAPRSKRQARKRHPDVFRASRALRAFGALAGGRSGFNWGAG
jgi:hypothetical protein